MRPLKRVAGWFAHRLGLSSVLEHTLLHKIPADATRWPAGWMYIFGNALVAVFVLQLVTGTALATKYIPAPDHAYESLHHINQEVWFGAFVRAVHYYGASAIIILLALHMGRVFLTGSYKYPRELNWMSGVILLFLFLAMAATGQLLRWDQDGVWTVVVGSKFAGRVPVVGEWLMEFVLAGETLGGATLSRFYALHVIILPLVILLVMGLHVFLVFYHGISEPPRAGRPVEPETYKDWYRRLKEEDGVPYFPFAAWRELVFIAVVFVSVAVVAWLAGPKGPGLPPDPTVLQADPRPDWYLVWYYALIWLKPRAADDLTMVYLPILTAVILLALPLVANRGERHPARRPWAIAIVAAAVLAMGTLTGMGLRPYWVPHFVTEPFTLAELEPAPPEVVAGAGAFYDRGCQYCHFVVDRGGRYGPDLTYVTRRVSREEITVRIVVGIRNMPPYRDILTGDELEAILAFLDWTGRRP